MLLTEIPDQVPSLIHSIALCGAALPYLHLDSVVHARPFLLGQDVEELRTDSSSSSASSSSVPCSACSPPSGTPSSSSCFFNIAFCCDLLFIALRDSLEDQFVQCLTCILLDRIAHDVVGWSVIFLLACLSVLFSQFSLNSDLISFPFSFSFASSFQHFAFNFCFGSSLLSQILVYEERLIDREHSIIRRFQHNSSLSVLELTPPPRPS